MSGGGRSEAHVTSGEGWPFHDAILTFFVSQAVQAQSQAREASDVKLSTSHPLTIPAWAIARARRRLACVLGRVIDCPGVRAWAGC
jgi:hypothetical protein